jgi:hypothetical protein
VLRRCGSRSTPIVRTVGSRPSCVPTSAGLLSGAQRSRLVLDVLHTSMLQLAPHRGWSVEALARVRSTLLTTGVGFEWASPWKSSPNRALEARAVFRVADDGFGRVVVEVRDRRSRDLVARSRPAITFSGPSGFRQVTQTLRWRGTMVEVIPLVTTIGKEHFGDVLTIDPGTTGIAPLPPIDEAISEHSPLPIVLAPYGVREDDPAPGVEVFEILDLGEQGPGVEQLSAVEGMTTFTSRLEMELSEASQRSTDIAGWREGRPIEVTLVYETPDAWGRARPGTASRRAASRTRSR